MPGQGLMSGVDATLNILRTLRDINWLRWQAYKRNNPAGSDKPFTWTQSQEVKAGETKEFRFSVSDPRNQVYFLRKVDFSFYNDTEYRLSKDGKVLIVPLITAGFDEGINFEPPVIVKKYVMLRIVNNSISDRTYHWSCLGWKRYK